MVYWEEKYLAVCKYLHKKTVREEKRQPIEERTFVVSVMKGNDPEKKAIWILHKFHCLGKLKDIVLHKI